MSNMPNYPTDPAPVAGQPGLPLPAKPAAPVDVQNSVKAWFASIVVGLVAGLLAFFATDQVAALKEAMGAAGGVTEEQAQLAITVGLAVGLVFALVGLGLRVFFVFKLKAGRNWARIVLTVLAAISALGTLTGLVQGFTIATAFDLIALLLMVAAVVLMFRPAANEYFAKPKA